MEEEIRCPVCNETLQEEGMPCSACGWIPEGYTLDPDKKEWFYVVGSRYKGPFTPLRIRELIKDTTISENTLLWQENKRYATTAGKSPFKDEFLVPITPPPLKLLSDRYALSLMSVPVFVCIIISAFLKPTLAAFAILALIYLVLGYIFLRADIKEVKKRGFDFFEKWMYFGIVIAPLYLLPRAEHTNKKFMYSLAWVIFVLIFFLR